MRSTFATIGLQMTVSDRERYSRQIRFAELGESGQGKLLDAHAVVVGCGALGSTHAMILARAGVGRLTIIDRDFVEESNLQRQFLFDEADALGSLPKAVAAKRKLEAANSRISLEAAVADLNSDNAAELLGRCGVILDGTDNFETRYLINDYAVQRGVPWIYGAAVGSYGIAMPVIPGRSACFRCVYPDPPQGVQPTCETAGVLNTVTALIGTLQAAEAIKILSGNADRVRLKITTADTWNGPLREIDQPPRDPDCPACGRREFPWLAGEHRAPVSLCGRNAVQLHERHRPLDLAELRSRLAPLGEVRSNEFALRFFISPYDLTLFADGRCIVKGTTDVGIAKSLYSRYVGN